ncbi:hypothetical protein COV11_02745 [Candidatus Woesearchaeota archaeon CG10_big_fil_rev_8_21_14_0_10_30_7]|nr:MAG: hypothetical protein COV11_02745 [Candidatus Woesearchaeota archaeon CG10_big_fil_rev_8_21_14_0_10_30_7]
MDSQKVKKKLTEIFGVQLKFNKNFDKRINCLKEGMIESFIEWCQRCKDNKELGSVPPKKEHKNLYVFFRKIASDIRVILIKEQKLQKKFLLWKLKNTFS